MYPSFCANLVWGSQIVVKKMAMLYLLGRCFFQKKIDRRRLKHA
jgi:hypothetical protein